MRRLLLSFAAVTACALALAGSVLAVRPTSWADSTHGWKTGVDRKTNVPIVLSTENGGRTWHRIGSGFAVGGLVRTSVSAGVVVGDQDGPIWWWTRDNGRHWYQAPERLISGEFQGSGRFLFWTSKDLKTIFQVRPWPPRGAAPRGCRRPGNCYLPVSAKARAVAVARLSNDGFSSLTNVPGGILAVVVSRPPSSRARVFLRQSGRNQMIELPTVTGVRPCFNLGQEPVVTWPKIVVFGCAGTTATVAWVSEDGGKAWQVYRR
jgi:hypothetical protein